jgi:hypothetical protein
MNPFEPIKPERAHPFIKKLHYVLSSNDFGDLFFWDSDNEFCIKDSEDFQKEVLDPVFQLSRFKTFTRLLYRFGFKKTRSRPKKSGISSWANQFFRRNR